MLQSLERELRHARVRAATVRQIVLMTRTLGCVALVLFGALLVSSRLNTQFGDAAQSLPLSMIFEITAGSLLAAMVLLQRRGQGNLFNAQRLLFGLIAILSAVLFVDRVFFQQVPYIAAMPSLALSLLSGAAFLRRNAMSLSLVMVLASAAFSSSAFAVYFLQGADHRSVAVFWQVLGLLVLSLAFFLRMVRSPMVRPLVFDTAWSRVAHLQIGAVLLCMGFVGVLSVQLKAPQSLLIVLILAMWQLVLVILAAGPIFERATREHRARERSLRHQAHRDPLTGLYNRRAVLGVELMADEKDVADPEPRSVGVILADVDRFKSINDSMGHDGGDLVLRQIASLIRAKVGPEDVVIRWGGEEFLVLLPGAIFERTMSVAHLIRAEVASQIGFGEADARKPVTLSVGVAQFHGACDERPLDLVIQDADAALYKAKSTGRNRVETLEKTSARKSLKPEDFLPKADELH